MIALLALASCDLSTDPDGTNGSTVAADPCEEPGNICTWLGVPQTAMLSGEGTDRSADLATGTFLYMPMDITFAPDGTAYYSDYNNHRVRRVSVDDVVTTVSGTGFLGEPDGPCDDGCDALNAPWNHPVGVAVDTADPDSLWVAAPQNLRVNRLDVEAELLYWAAAGFLASGVASHPDGDVYVTDVDADVIRRLTPEGVLEVVGPEPSGLLLEVGPGLALDGDTLLVADTGNGLVRSIDLAACAEDLSTCVIEDFAGPFASPRDVAVGLDGAVYVADSEEHCVWVVRDGIVEPFAGQCGSLGGYAGDGGPATSALLAGPSGVAVDPDGAIFVADTGNHIVRRIVP